MKTLSTPTLTLIAANIKSLGLPERTQQELQSNYVGRPDNDPGSDGKFRWDTSFIYDYSRWLGIDTSTFEDALSKRNPTVRDIIDMYFAPKATSLGQFPFETLFLNVHRRKYGLSKKYVHMMERSVMEGVGNFGYAMLIDTINFVMTGRRDIPISTLLTYMDSRASDSYITVSENFDRDEVAKLSTIDFLMKWISTEKGMYDCIQMHRIVFNIKS